MGKWTNLKTGVSRKQSTPRFPKNEHFLPPDTHTYVYISGGGKKSWFFRKIWCALFSWNTRLKTALLPYYRQNYKKVILQKIIIKVSPNYTVTFFLQKQKNNFKNIYESTPIIIKDSKIVAVQINGLVSIW